MGISYKWKLFEKNSKIESNACFFMEAVFIKKLYRFQSLWKVFCYVLKLESILKKRISNSNSLIVEQITHWISCIKQDREPEHMSDSGCKHKNYHISDRW